MTKRKLSIEEIEEMLSITNSTNAVIPIANTNISTNITPHIQIPSYWVPDLRLNKWILSINNSLNIRAAIEVIKEFNPDLFSQYLPFLIILSVYQNQLTVMQEIINIDRINTVDFILQDGDSILMKATELGNIEMVKLLLDNSVNVDYINNNNNAFKIAQAKNNNDMIKLIQDFSYNNNMLKLVNMKGDIYSNIESIEQLKALDEIEFKANSKLDHHDIIVISNFLSINQSLTGLCLNTANYFDGYTNSLNYESALALANALEINNSLIELNLNYYKIDTNSIRVLTQSLNKNSTLNTLDITNTNLNNSMLKILFKNLKDNNILVNFKLGYNKIDDIGVVKLVKVMSNGKVIDTLDLSGNNSITSYGVSVLTKFLPFNNTLKTLDLRYINIEDEESAALLDALRNNSTLISLNLNSSICDTDTFRSTVKSFAKLLETNVTLTSIGLAYNEFNDDEVVAIAHALKNNKTLTYLDLRNPTGKIGFNAIFESLKNNKYLQIDTDDDVYHNDCRISALNTKSKQAYNKMVNGLSQAVNNLTYQKDEIIHSIDQTLLIGPKLVMFLLNEKPYIRSIFNSSTHFTQTINSEQKDLINFSGIRNVTEFFDKIHANKEDCFLMSKMICKDYYNSINPYLPKEILMHIYSFCNSHDVLESNMTPTQSTVIGEVNNIIE